MLQSFFAKWQGKADIKIPIVLAQKIFTRPHKTVGEPTAAKATNPPCPSLSAIVIAHSTEYVLCTVRNLQEAVILLVAFVHLGHHASNSWCGAAREQENRLLRGHPCASGLNNVVVDAVFEFAPRLPDANELNRALTGR